MRLSVSGGELQAYIAPAHGADLAGLEVRRDGHWSELLYRGMNYQPTGGWTGKAPILWPAVGRNFPYPAGGGHGDDLGWVLHGRVHAMPIHGFARDQAWRIVRRGSCAGSAFLILGLSNNDRTRRMYPFGFTLTTEYRIWRDALYIRQAVHAHRANAEPMPFSIGNHITFGIPLLAGDDPRQTTISTPATEQVITDGSGRPTGRIVTVSYVEATTPVLVRAPDPDIALRLRRRAGMGAVGGFAPALRSSLRTPKTGGRPALPFFSISGVMSRKATSRPSLGLASRIRWRRVMGRSLSSPAVRFAGRSK